MEVDTGQRYGTGCSFLITFNHTLQYYDSLSCLSYNCMRIGALFSIRPSLHSLFRLFLALMMHSCRGLEPHHIVLRPDLPNTNAFDKLNRTGSLTLWGSGQSFESPADTKGPKSHLHRMPCLKTRHTQTALCVCVGVYECVLSSAGLPCICVCDCVWLRKRGRGSKLLQMVKEYVNFSLESGQKPLSFFFFFLSFVSRIYE